MSWGQVTNKRVRWGRQHQMIPVWHHMIQASYMVLTWLVDDSDDGGTFVAEANKDAE